MKWRMYHSASSLPGGATVSCPNRQNGTDIPSTARQRFGYDMAVYQATMQPQSWPMEMNRSSPRAVAIPATSAVSLRIV